MATQLFITHSESLCPYCHKKLKHTHKTKLTKIGEQSTADEIGTILRGAGAAAKVISDVVSHLKGRGK